jgi:hypothetical protein
VGTWNEKPARTFVESKTNLAGFAFPLLASVLRVSASLPFVGIRRCEQLACQGNKEKALEQFGRFLSPPFILRPRIVILA